MRANITYSVDVRNIPDEVTRIVLSEANTLTEDMLGIQAALGERNFTEARNKIMSARQALGNTDIRLYELDQIMASYIDLVNQDEQQQEAPIGESSEESETNEDG
jgi:hypothetical protein